jgi:hypothetical protein
MIHLAVIVGFEKNTSGQRGYRIGIEVLYCSSSCWAEIAVASFKASAASPTAKVVERARILNYLRPIYSFRFANSLPSPFFLSSCLMVQTEPLGKAASKSPRNRTAVLDDDMIKDSVSQRHRLEVEMRFR